MDNKLSKHQHFLRCLIFIFSTVFSLQLAAQDTSYTRPPVVSDYKEYLRQVKDDSDRQMVELKHVIADLVYDLKYAGSNNFMHRRMYPAGTSTTFMRLPAASALALVASELRLKGYRLKIFDAYRPYSVTVKFWELVKDERYVANPAKGSGHNRGIAVDLTIINSATGKELNMGTGFDNFSDTAHQDFTGLADSILQNRKMLRTVMEKHGFKALETEWWHFFLAEGARFEILDIDFSGFARRNTKLGLRPN